MKTDLSRVSHATSAGIRNRAAPPEQQFGAWFKFTPGGGQITVSAELRGNDAAITVRDTGPGIDAEKIPSLFQKFHRFETSEPHEGIGLGLYIVKELVEAHGGRTEVDSVIGKGSAFSLFLPLTLS